MMDLLPHIKRCVDKGSHLMTDQLHTYDRGTWGAISTKNA